MNTFKSFKAMKNTFKSFKSIPHVFELWMF